MNRTNISRIVPPGTDWQQELKWIGCGLGTAALYSFIFPIRLSRALYRLRRYDWDPVNEAWYPSAQLPDFAELLGSALTGFLLVALAMLALAALHYAGHYSGSRSIYLMRRLPSRWELHRRCLTMPALGLAICVVTMLILFFLFYALYMLATPDAVLVPGQLNQIWSVM